jgi:DNA repair exonuclease SbcCD ATPase subunit
MIEFEYVQVQNYFSVGSTPIKILLNRSPTTLVVGENGAGKSAILLDGLNFGLFGKPFRSINKGAVVNSINQGDCVVEIGFRVGSKRYKIRRGLKPTIFEIYENDQIINQDAAAKDYQDFLEESILCGLNEKVFKQLVVIGSADYIPFMKLPAAARREVHEEVFDIKIFSQMLVIAKEKLSTFKEELSELDRKIELEQEKINLQKKNQTRLSENTTEKVTALNETIVKFNKEIDDLQVLVEEAQAKKADLCLQVATSSLVKKSRQELQTLENQLKNKRNSVVATMKFFAEHEDCPTCHQLIHPQHKEHIYLQNDKKKTDLDEGIAKVDAEVNKKLAIMMEMDKIEVEIGKIERAVYQWQVNITSLQRHIQTLEREIKSTALGKDTLEIETLLKAHEATLAALKSVRIEMIEERQYHEIVADMLKDGGIKTKIIRQYVPVMNKIINEYLVRFGLPIEFTLDENFNETIKSRYRDTFSYNNFSEGEKQRIDTALLLAWRQIAKAKNTTNCNILIMDETFDSSLDAMATDELLNILLEMDKNTNIFIMSHKSDLGDKLRSTITFEKQGNFTRMVESIK